MLFFKNKETTQDKVKKNAAQIQLEKKSPSEKEVGGNEVAWIASLQAISEGNFNHTVAGDHPVSQAIHKLAMKLQAGFKQELQRTVTLSSMASESMAAVSFVTGDCNIVSENAHAIAAASEQLSATSKEVAEGTKRILENAQEVSANSTNGRQAVQTAIRGMTEINRVVTETEETVTDLSVASQEINQILGVITKISSQTKMLSLNALIEAARAGGEVGKGFAVVADEVKELAVRSANASEEIGEKIRHIQGQVQSILQGVQKTTAAVANGQTSVDKAGSEMESISDRIQDITQLIAQNASSMDEQALATDDVTNKITTVSNKAQRCAENTEKAISAVAGTEKVIQEKFQLLGEMEIPDVVVDLAKSDHFLWKKRLAEMLIGRNQLQESELSDHHGCRLGKWYDSQTDPRYTKNPVFKKLIEPHGLVHKHAMKAIVQFNQGNIDAAMAAYDKMEHASKDVMTCLNALG